MLLICVLLYLNHDWNLVVVGMRGLTSGSAASLPSTRSLVRAQPSSRIRPAWPLNQPHSERAERATGGLEPKKEEWVGMLLCLMFLVTSNVWAEESVRNRKDAKIWRAHRGKYSPETVENAVKGLLCGTGHFVLLCTCALVVR